MKLGSIEINIKARQPKPQRVELGATGTLFFAGQLAEEEYNPDLRGEKALKTYDKMRKSDGQVKAALLACVLPLHSARWDIQSPSDSREDQAIAEFVRRNLFEQMTITWDDFLAHALLMLPFGFSVFEKVWELVDNRYRWRKLAPRLPKSISEWKLDPEGGLAGVKQWIFKDNKYVNVSIPVEKLLVFTNEREGSNYQGVSLLRAAYKHWYYKDQLYRIDGIAAERHGVGLAVFKLPPTATTGKEDSDYGKINKIGQTLHTHERSYVALPSDYEFDLKGVSGQLHDIIRSAEHHDMQIARSILAQFINLGGKEVGSYALSQDQSGFFLMSLRAAAGNICDVVNRYAIKQLVDYNWNVEQYPRLVVSGLEHRDIGVYCKAVTDVVNAGLILPDREIEAELRQFLHLPMPRKQKPAQATERYRLAEYEPPRHPRGPEVFVAFKDIDKKLNAAEEVFVKEAKGIQDRQIGRIVDVVIKYVEKGQIDRVATIDVPFKTEMADAIKGVLIDLYKYGRDEVKKEIAKQRQGVKAVEPLEGADEAAILEFIEARAKASANVLASKLRAALTWAALHQIREGTVDRAGLSKSLTAISDKELMATAKFSVSESFNLGRQREARIEAGDIDRVIYSALLDANTCDACADLDGREYEFPSSDWDDVAPPYRNCEGQDRCRCVGVYVYKTERKSIE